MRMIISITATPPATIPTIIPIDIPEDFLEPPPLL